MDVVMRGIATHKTRIARRIAETAPANPGKIRAIVCRIAARNVAMPAATGKRTPAIVRRIAERVVGTVAATEVRTRPDATRIAASVGIRSAETSKIHVVASWTAEQSAETPAVVTPKTL